MKKLRTPDEVKALRAGIWDRRDTGETWAQIGRHLTISGSYARAQWHHEFRLRNGRSPTPLEMNSVVELRVKKPN